MSIDMHPRTLEIYTRLITAMDGQNYTEMWDEAPLCQNCPEDMDYLSWIQESLVEASDHTRRLETQIQELQDKLDEANGYISEIGD